MVSDFLDGTVNTDDMEEDFFKFRLLTYNTSQHKLEKSKLKYKEKYPLQKEIEDRITKFLDDINK